MTKESLVVSAYWQLPAGNEIDSISSRMSDVLSGTDPGPVDLGSPLDMDACLAAAKQKRNPLFPHKDQLEEDFNTDLSFLKVRVGESRALAFIEREWVRIGETIFFAELEPDYTTLHTAIEDTLSNRKRRLVDSS